MKNSVRPFDTIENTQAFLELLGDTVDGILGDARRELRLHPSDRQLAQAWHVIIYKATKLSAHVANSRRIMSDLLIVRSVLEEIRQEAPAADDRREQQCVA